MKTYRDIDLSIDAEIHYIFFIHWITANQLVRG